MLYFQRIYKTRNWYSCNQTKWRKIFKELGSLLGFHLWIWLNWTNSQTEIYWQRKSPLKACHLRKLLVFSGALSLNINKDQRKEKNKQFGVKADLKVFSLHCVTALSGVYYNRKKLCIWQEKVWEQRKVITALGK